MIFSIIEKELVVYRTSNKNEPFNDWVNKLDLMYKRRIKRRVLQLQNNNFGDYKLLRDGVYELRCHFGAGYRVYFEQRSGRFVILLCGGDKGTQNKDIERAISYWKDYKEKSHD